MSSQSQSEGDFDFSVGDTVLVRVREHGTSGNITTKFVAECTSIEPRGVAGTRARFKLPGMMNTVTYRSYEAEFETVESKDEVNF